MAQKIQLPPPAAYWDVMALLRVLADPEIYGERLQELGKLRDEIVERSECEESYERQHALEADAKAKLGEATRLLDSARAEATKIRTEAEADAVIGRESLRLSREEWAAARAAEQDELASRGAELEERARIAREQVESAKTMLSRAEYLMREASQLQAEYTEKVTKLKGIVA